MSKICKNCGRVMRDKARFCMTCGTSLLPDQPAEVVKEAAVEADIKEVVSEPEITAESATEEVIKETEADVEEAAEKTEEAAEAVENIKEEPEDELAIEKRAFGYVAPPVEEKEETVSPEPPEKKIKPWMWIAAACVLIVGAAIAVLAITGVI